MSRHHNVLAVRLQHTDTIRSLYFFKRRLPPWCEASEKKETVVVLEERKGTGGARHAARRTQ